MLLTQKNLLLVQNRWIFAVRGVSSMIFGVYFITFQDATLLLLVRAFAFFATLDGLLGILAAFLVIKNRAWKALFFATGFIDLAVASIALIQPIVTAFLLFLMAGPMIVLTGIAELTAGFLFRGRLAGARLMTVGE